MKITLKLILATMLTNTLFITGCASTASNTSKETTNPIVLDTEMSTSKSNTIKKINYSLPESVFEGYWAVIKPERSQDTVVSLRKADNYSYNNQVNTTLYKYTCDTDGSYIQTATSQAILNPTKDSMLMAMKGETQPFSTIEVLRIAPKKAMVINQGFLDSDSLAALPDGINFVYVYTDTLKPLCALVDK